LAALDPELQKNAISSLCAMSPDGMARIRILPGWENIDVAWL